MSGKKFTKLIEKAVDSGFSVWWRYALFRTRKQEDADEVVQDALYRTLRARPNLKSEEEASRYIWTVIRTTSVRTIGAARSGVRTKEITDEAFATSEQTFGRSPLEALIKAEREDGLAQTLEVVMEEFKRLPEELKQAVELHVLREPPLRLREIAKVQGVAISTVHDRVSRGLRQLALAITVGKEEQK